MKNAHLPLPTPFSRSSQQKINTDSIYNPSEGWMSAENHPCKILYDSSKPYIQNYGIAIDIGCRYGEFAYFCQNDFSKTICFDPIVNKAFKVNTDPRKILHFNCALGSSYELIKMYGGSHANSLNHGKKPTFIKGTKHYSQSIPLDYFKFGADKIGLIKIDTEGFEYNVLKGASKTILGSNSVIIIEQNGLNMEGESPQQALTYLEKNGFKAIESIKNKHNEVTDFLLVPEKHLRKYF